MNLIEQFFQLSQDSFLSATVIFGNSLSQYLSALITGLITIVICRLIIAITIKYIAKVSSYTQNPIPAILVEIMRSIKWWFYASIGLYTAISSLNVADFFQHLVLGIIIVLITFQFTKIIDALESYILSSKFPHISEGSEQAAFHFISLMAKICVWLLATLLYLSNIGVNVNSMIAALGVGGVAIAFASQSIIEDLFNSVTILLDKPFTVGDSVVVSNKRGKVEKIGLRNTRLRTPLGDELIVPNTDMTKNQVQNFKRMEQRLVKLQLGVTYQTTHKKLQKIPSIIESIIESASDASFSRCQIRTFGDSAIIFDVVYHVQNGDFSVHTAIRHQIILDIIKAFETEKIDIAYPTRTLYLHQS